MKYLLIPIALLLFSCSTRKVQKSKTIDKTHNTELSEISHNNTIDSVSLSFVKKYVKNAIVEADSVHITDKSIKLYGVKSETNETNTITGDSLIYKKNEQGNKTDLKQHITDNYSYNKNVDKKSLPFWGYLTIGAILYFIVNAVLKYFANRRKL